MTAAQRLFRLQRIDTWAFDAELLFLSKRLGLTVAKIPVRWQRRPRLPPAPQPGDRHVSC